MKRELDPSGGVTGSFLGAPDPCTGEFGPVFGLTVCFTWGTVRATCPLHGQPGLSTSVSTEVPGDPAPNPRPQLPPGPGPPPTPTSPSSAVPCRTPGLCQASEYPSGLHFFRCFLAPQLHLKPGFPPRVLCPHLPLSLLDNVASFLPNFRSRRNPCCPVLPAASSLPSSTPLPPALSSSTPFPVIMLSDVT